MKIQRIYSGRASPRQTSQTKPLFYPTNYFRLVHGEFPPLNTQTLSCAPKIILIMGVAGSGKSTVGRMLAATLHWPYYEADDFHPPHNIAKMSQGLPLDDNDRLPWLLAIRSKIDDCLATGQSAVFTCSALKEKYRVILGSGSADFRLVHLTGDVSTILARVGQRQGHYLRPELVQSQFDALELPKEAQTLDIKFPPEDLVQMIVRKMNGTLPPTSR